MAEHLKYCLYQKVLAGGADAGAGGAGAGVTISRHIFN
jgi:hypothetical protein